MSATVAAVALFVLAAPLCYLNLYFLLLSREGWEGAARRVGVLASRCGVDTGTCAVVARTGWSRAVFGVPNTVFGLAWCGVLIGLGAWWLQAGAVVVPWWALAGASATVAAAVVLIYALVVRLQQPCPL